MVINFTFSTSAAVHVVVVKTHQIATILYAVKGSMISVKKKQKQSIVKQESVNSVQLPCFPDTTGNS